MESTPALMRQSFVDSVRRSDVGASLLETVLRNDPLVAAHVILERRTAAGEVVKVAYVVVEGPADRRMLSARLPESERPFVVVLLARLPRDSRGEVELAALEAIVVPDEAIERALVSAAEKLPGVEVVEVGFEEYAEPPPRVHLFEVLSPSERRAQPNDPTSVSAGATRASAETPAIAEGPPLMVPIDAPATFVESIERAAKNTGVLRFVEEDGRVIEHTWATLLEASERALSHLRDLHLAKGTAVLIQLERAEDVLTAFWGALLGGYVPLIAAVPPSYREPNAALDRIAGALDLFGEKRPAIFTTAAHAAETRALAPIAIATIESARASARAIGHHAAQPEDVALYNLTSGSTGAPKCIMLTHASLLARARGANLALAATERDVALSFLPFDHIGSISDWHLRIVELAGNAIYASKNYVLGKITRWLELIDRHQVTGSWAPNFAYDLLSRALAEAGPEAAYHLGSLRCLLSAGESVSPKTIETITEQLARYGMRRDVLTPAFGMAELGSGITYADRARDGALITHELDRGGSKIELVDLGRPIPGVALRVVGENNGVLAEGEVGRVQTRGACVARGYFANPAATRASFQEDGWFDTGDSGFLARGRLVLTGRTKDTIIVKGVNYYDHEIEAAVEQLDGVEPSFTAACAVRRTPGATSEELAVFFVPRTAGAAEVRAKITAELGVTPDFLIPIRKDRIPKTEIGKIKRRELARDLERGVFDREIIKADRALANARTLPAWFFRPIWTRAEALPSERGNLFDGSIYVFDNPRLAEVLRARGARVSDRFQESTRAIAGAFDAPSLLKLLPSLEGRRIQFLLLGKHADPAGALSTGVLAAAAQEMEGLSARSLIVDPFSPEEVADELAIERSRFEVVRRKGERFVAGLERVRFDTPRRGLPIGGLYLVTGANGGVGNELVRWLELEYRARVIRAGRGTDLTAEVARAEAQAGREVDAIFHLAGVYSERAVAEETRDSFAEVVAAKLAAAKIFERLLAERPGCRLIVFSSLAAFFGGARLGAYGAANRAIETFASMLGERATVIAWSVWRDLGIGRSAPIDQLRRMRGYLPIGRDEGLRSLEVVLAQGPGRYLVGLDAAHRNVRRFLVDGVPELERAVVRWRGRKIARVGGAGAPEQVDRAAFAGISAQDRIGARVGGAEVAEQVDRAAFAGISARDRFGARVVPVFLEEERDAAEKVAPRTETEARIAGIWRAVLGVAEVGVEENFFQLGGHSLLATQLVSRVRDTFAIELPIAKLFEAPTIAGLARIVDGAAPKVDDELAQLIAEVDNLSDEEVRALLAAETTPAPMPRASSWAGARTDAARILAELAATAPITAAPATIETIAIITNDRPAALRRAAESYAALASHRNVELLILDDSEDPQIRQQNREQLRALKTPALYAGREEKLRFARELANKADVPLAIIEYALFRSAPFKYSAGANRNALILATAGRAIFSADDDTIAEPRRAPERTTGLRLAARVDPADLYFFPDRKSVLSALNIHDRGSISSDPSGEHLFSDRRSPPDLSDPSGEHLFSDRRSAPGRSDPSGVHNFSDRRSSPDFSERRDERDLSDRANTPELDLLAEHEAILGRDIASIYAHNAGGELSTAGRGDQILAKLRALAPGKGRVRMTIPGLAGDCGWGVPFGYWGAPMGYLLAAGESHERLVASEADYRSACTSREIIRAVDRLSLTDETYSMGTFMGIDNRVLMPPHVPVLRGQDIIFGAMISAAHEDAFFAHLPHVLLHAPVERRAYWPGEVLRSASGFDATKLLVNLVHRLNLGTSADPADRLHRMGQALLDLSKRPTRELFDLIRTQAAEENAKFLALIEEAIAERGERAPFWAADLSRYAELLREAEKRPDYHLPLDLLTLTKNADEAKALLKHTLEKLAELTIAWPAMYEAARGLQMAERP